MFQYRHIFIYSLFLLIVVKGSAQTGFIDSLKLLLDKATDTNRVNLLNKISKAYWYIDPTKTIEYAAQAIDLAQKINHKTGITSGYNNTGVAYYQQNKYEEALQWYNKALRMHRETGNYTGEGYVLTNMGLIYWKQGALTTAVEYYLQALKIWEDHHLENEISSVFDNIGNVYNEQGDFDRVPSQTFTNPNGKQLTIVGTGKLSTKNFKDDTIIFQYTVSGFTNYDGDFSGARK